MLGWVRDLLSPLKANEDHRRLWSARLAAMEYALGRCDGSIYRASPADHRLGDSDVLRFRHYVNGVAYATCGLIGDPRQIANRWGRYELMLCTAADNDWAPQLLSHLARYTHESTLQPGDIMDLVAVDRPANHPSALLFVSPEPPADSFNVAGEPASLLLALGITVEEFTACKTFGSGVLLRKLRETGIYPLSQLDRSSVL